MPASSAAVLDYLRAQREPLVAFLGELVRAESPSSDPESQSGVRSPLAAELGARGFATGSSPGGGPAAIWLRARAAEGARRASSS